VEGTSSYGAGLTEFLLAQGEQVVEVCRPKRPPRRAVRTSDALDVTRAAREVPGGDDIIQPCRGEREALRVLVTTWADAISARTAAAIHLTVRLRRRARGAPLPRRSGVPDLVTDMTDWRWTRARTGSGDPHTKITAGTVRPQRSLPGPA
jgi:hypothetical protein